MISENSIMKPVENDRDIVVIPNDIPEFTTPDYDLFDEKDANKYIMDLERMVRQSYEYREMVKYLRENMNMNSCSFLPNVTNENSFKIRIELHHSPLTLRDICATIMNKRMKNGENMNIEAVAYEVMYVHYCLMIGLIPLSETVHELVHTQYIFIPLDKVYGYYRQFINQYYDYIEPELLDKLDNLEKLTIEGSYNEQYKQVLEKKYIAVDMGENSQLDKLHDLQSLLKQKINESRDEFVTTTQSPQIIHPENIIRYVNPYEKID